MLGRNSSRSTRALRTSTAGIPSSLGNTPGRNRIPVATAQLWSLLNAAVSGPATSTRPSISMRSMHPSGRTRVRRGESLTHVHSTNSRSRAGAGSSR